MTRPEPSDSTTEVNDVIESEAPPLRPDALSPDSTAQEIAELKDQLLRALAEQQNMQRRHSQELATARDYAARDFAFSLLSVKDTLEMVLRDQQSSIEQIKTGVEMTLRNLIAAFERHRIHEIASDRARFDPNLHQAMTQIESDEPPGTVLSTFQKGYMMGERCLRPAMVAVAKARTVAATGPDAAEVKTVQARAVEPDQSASN